MQKRTYVVFLSLCLILFLCFSIPLSNGKNSKPLAVDATLDAKPVIVIDCGHGGEDGGAVSSDGVLEKDINLKIGLVLEKFFLQGGFKVRMIRREDISVYDDSAETLREKKVSDLHKRAEICNSDSRNIYISIHQNKFEDSKYYGTQVFYSKNNPESKELAECIRAAVKGLLQNENERKCKEATKDIYVLDNAQVPAVIVECGFLSNYEETQKLLTDEYRNQLAYSIYSGFLEYYYAL
ncbi:MAG: N-acetylmuramoyl-L-alanine amidase [Ruminococcaceae bacterium]|nr:N-acetylmuramoyl-L-alanine amidase [Oscillospiraceae bacterium]